MSETIPELHAKETPLQPESNSSIAPEVSRFIDTTISNGALAAILELNNNDPPLERDEREAIVYTALDILVHRLKSKGKEDMGEAKNFVRLANAKRRQRGQYVLGMFKN